MRIQKEHSAKYAEHLMTPPNGEIGRTKDGDESTL